MCFRMKLYNAWQGANRRCQARKDFMLLKDKKHKSIQPSIMEKIMFTTAEEQATTILQDRHLDNQQREFAVHYLAGHPTPVSIKALVGALQYKEFAIRWIASTALSQLGFLALPEVLRALLNPELNTAPLRESVIHILHYSSNLANEPVYKHQHIDPVVSVKQGISVSVNELLSALKGPAADINSMKAAGKLLSELEKYQITSDDV